MGKKNIALKVAGLLLLTGFFLAIAGRLMHGTFNSVLIGRNGIYTTKESGETMTTKLTSFKNIDISICSGRIELIKSNKDAVEYNLHNSEKVTVCDVIGDTFTFKTEARFTISLFNFQDTYVKIYYKDDAELENIFLKTISGSVDANDITAKNVTIKSTSGSQSISNIKADEIELNETSGSIKVANISGDTVSVKNNSGSVTIDGIRCKDISIKSISGSTKLYNADTNSATINGTSGSIYIQGSPKGKTFINSVSGSIKVYSNLPKSEYGYKLSSTSGSTKVDDSAFKGSVGEEKANFIDASNTSGSVKLYFNSMDK